MAVSWQLCHQARSGPGAMEILKLLEKLFETSPTRVLVLEDFEGLRLPGGAVASAKRGDKIELPRWVARLLEERGIVRRLFDELAVEDVARAHYRELARRSLSDLQKLPDNFYWIVRDYVSYLKRAAASSADAKLLDTAKRLEACLSDVVEKRIQAILSLSASPVASEYKSRLLPEEVELLEAISELVQSWASRVKPVK